jgi:hypothetical protein
MVLEGPSCIVRTEAQRVSVFGKRVFRGTLREAVGLLRRDQESVDRPLTDPAINRFRCESAVAPRRQNPFRTSTK